MTRRNPLLATLLLLPLVSSLGCQGTEDNRAAKRGAAGGALVGLTMGALTGDASLAAKGAAAGAVAGGVAGSMEDLRYDRDKEMNQNTAGAISSIGSGGTGQSSPEDQRPQTWSQLNNCPGKWNCSIWGIAPNGQRVTGTASFAASLQSTSAARFDVTSFESSAAVDVSVSGYFVMSYSPDSGYELRMSFSDDPGEERWVGEKLGAEEKYSFYYVGSKAGGSTNRVELRCIGRDLMIVSTYARDAQGAETQVQEYRLTRG